MKNEAPNRGHQSNRRIFASSLAWVMRYEHLWVLITCLFPFCSAGRWEHAIYGMQWSLRLPREFYELSSSMWANIHLYTCYNFVASSIPSYLVSTRVQDLILKVDVPNNVYDWLTLLRSTSAMAISCVLWVVLRSFEASWLVATNLEVNPITTDRKC